MNRNVPFSDDEIDEVGAAELSQEILGNEIIRQLICNRAKDDLVSTAIVYDHKNESFDDKVTNSINDTYRRDEAQLLIDFVKKARRSVSEVIPFEDGEIGVHTANLRRQNSIRGR